MLAAKIYKSESEVQAKLAEFGTSLREAFGIVRAVVGARAETVDNDPAGTAGQFGYIYGTRSVRAVFRPKGWEKLREENVEAVSDPTTKRQIVYQNVDLAGGAGSPKAARGKGDGARRLIDAAQGSLFPEGSLPIVMPHMRAGVSQIWYFCVSVETLPDGTLCVGAELSLPLPFKGDNFGEFIERIVVRPPTAWDGGVRMGDDPSDENDEGAVEFEPKISRK